MRLPRTHVKLSLLLTLVLTVIVGLLFSPAMLTPHHTSMRVASRTEAGPPTPSEARETYGRIPLSFEANEGQTDASVNFLARGAGYTLFLKPTEAVFVLARQGAAQTDAHGGVDSDLSLIPHPSLHPSPRPRRCSA